MIRAMIETSLIDWDGKITMVLFCDMCNMTCPFCQNWELLNDPQAHDIIPWNTVQGIIKDQGTWLDVVVLTGGEPLVCLEDTTTLCKRIKNLNKSIVETFIQYFKLNRMIKLKTFWSELEDKFPITEVPFHGNQLICV